MRRPRMIVGISACLLAVASAVVASPASARPVPAPGSGRLEVYTGQVQGDDLAAIFELGVDRHDVRVTADPATPGTLDVEVILGPQQVEQLARQGIVLTPKTIDGVTPSDRATAEGQRGRTVFRRYDGPGGLKAEFERLAAKNAELAELQVIGQTLNGVDIVAMKVTKDPAATEDGSKPTAVYIAAQHAREWITPEMVRRLLRHVLDGYGKDQEITELLDTTELWFVPVSNPDGYDFSFEDGQRLWRKNLRDNDGDGEMTPEDGVDLNRNLPTHWGYDNEGSSPQPSSETYRGTAPGLRARDAGPRRSVRPPHTRVPRQLPLRGRAAAPWHRLAGGDAGAGRRDLRGDARRRRRARRSRLRPRHLRRALHDQRRDRHARAGALRHAQHHPGDVDVRDSLRSRSRRQLGAGGLRERLRVPRRREARPPGGREELPAGPGRRRLGGSPRRAGLRRRSPDRGLPARHLLGVLRRSADSVGVGQAGAHRGRVALPGGRRR